MRLNPFVYLSETDIRFYLVVIIGILVPFSQALIFGSVIIMTEVAYPLSSSVRFLLIISTLIIFPLLVYWIYRRFPRKIVKNSRLKKIEGKRFTEHIQYINSLYEEYPFTAEQPTLMYNLDKEASAFTFGTRNDFFIGMGGGLITDEFYDNINGFKSVFLHEMSHIENKDVEKAYFAESIIRTLVFTISIPLAVYILHSVYLNLSLLYTGIVAGHDINYIVSRMLLPERIAILGAIGLFFLIFWAVLHVLRSQIIRLREFYADAKVLEYEKSTEQLVETLEENSEKSHSRFELLTKFHPSIPERIQVLKDNSKLFIPSLVVAFSIGFLYGILEFKLPQFIATIISFEQMTREIFPPYYEVLSAFTSILIFSISMFAISSGFHKSILKDTFIDNSRYFSTKTVLNIVKFSLVFSLGWVFSFIMGSIETFGVYITELSTWASEFPLYPAVWLYHALYFLPSVIFLSFFTSMLIRRSFSKKEVKKNFLIITVLSSILYVLNRFVANQLLSNKALIVVFFLIFSVGAYALIKTRDKKLHCPQCNNKLLVTLTPELLCPHCQHNLYSWAVYPEFKNSSG